MRSDWDEDFGKKPDVQKRYPDITREEWHYLRLLLDNAAEAESRYDAVGIYASINTLRNKVKARLGEGDGKP